SLDHKEGSADTRDSTLLKLLWRRGRRPPPDGVQRALAVHHCMAVTAATPPNASNVTNTARIDRFAHRYLRCATAALACTWCAMCRTRSSGLVVKVCSTAP